LALKLKFTPLGDILSSALGRKVNNMWKKLIHVFTALVDQMRVFF
jgi:hypothetical protein